MNQKNLLTIPDEIIVSKIYMIRGIKVMLDRDLAVLYTVETKRLKEAVRRNIARFPEDFMFELTNEEFNEWRMNFSKSQSDKKGLRHPPFAFTEHGVLMLASVLNTPTAIQASIKVVRAFVRLREILSTNQELCRKLRDLEEKVDRKFSIVFKIFDELMKPPDLIQRPEVGFKIGKKVRQE